MTPRIVYWRIIALFTVLLSAALAAIAQDIESKKTFEGIVEMQFKNVERVQLFTFSVKNGRIRVEETGRDDVAPIVLVDHAAKKTFIILPSREEYIEVPIVTEPSESRQSKRKADIQKTELTDDILDYTCDQLIVKSDEKEIEVWATKELGTAGTFLTTITPKSLDPIPWQAEILGRGYFPLKVIERDSDGNEQTQLEVLSIQKKTLGGPLFRVPPGYEKVGRDALQPKQAPKKKRTR